MSLADDKITFHILDVDGKPMAFHDGVFGFGPVAKDKTTPPVPTWTDTGTRWVHWGDNDLLPTTWRQKMELVPIAGAAIAKKINLMQGEGIQWYKTEEFRRIGHKAEPVFLPEVEDWMAENRIEEEWWPAQCGDFCLPFNAFSEMILSKNREKITGLYHIAAEHARLSKATEQSSQQVDWLIYSYHFPFGTAQADQNRVAMPIYRWYDRVAFFEKLRGFKFGWHSRFPTPGLIYYARAWWTGLFKDGGWMDASANVPKIVQAMQKNQITIRYIIHYPESYFMFRYPTWQSMNADERQKIIEDKQVEINSYLAGTENAGKSILSVFRENETNGAAIGKPEIIAVDDKAKTGTWIPDSNFADQQIIQAFGLDPSQIGLAPEGGKMGAGSGSDKMQSYNQHILLNTADQRLVLEPLNFISKYNSWGLTAAVQHTTLTTQNESRNGIAASA